MKHKIILLLIFTILVLLGGLIFFKNHTYGYQKIVDERQVQFKKKHISIMIDKDIEQSSFEIIRKIIHPLEKFAVPQYLEIRVMELYAGIQAEDGRIKVGTSYLETPEFKKILIREAYQLYDNWIVEGLYQYIFEDREKEIDLSYFENHELSLFGARFFESFNDRQEIEALKNASYSLVTYLLEKDKEKLLLGKVDWEEIEDWAKKHQMDMSYYSQIFDVTNGIKVEDREIERLLLSTKYDQNGFDIRVVDMGEEWDSAFKLEQMLLLFAKENEALIQLIESEAPIFFKEHKDLILSPSRLDIALNSQYPLNFTSQNFIGNESGRLEERSQIILEGLHAYTIERCHAILGFKSPLWLLDALDNYLFFQSSSQASQKLYMRLKERLSNKDSFKEDYEKVLKKPYEGSLNQKIDYQIYDSLVQKYQDKYISKDFFEDRNHIYEYLILVRFPMIESDYEMATIGIKSNTVDIFNKRQYSGINEPNNLQIIGLYGFVMYLTKTYGLDKMMELRISDLRGKTFEEVFGKRYEELLEDYESEYYRIRKE